ncbi:MAG: hypothetical protein H6728_15845 [Myxococcales bacterium]|nr:hypothetical protein [Myxococcales bacterium]
MLQRFFYAMDLGEWEQAESLLPSLESVGGENTLWSRVLEASRGLACREEALKLVRHVMCKAPRCVGLYHAVSRLFLQLRNIEQAEYWWSIGTKIDPHNGLLWLLGARIALAQDHTEIANFRIQSATRFLGEEDRLLQRALGRLDMAKACHLWGEGQHEQALFWMRRALRYDPTWAEPWEALSGYLDSLGCKERAAWYATEARLRRKEVLA